MTFAVWPSVPAISEAFPGRNGLIAFSSFRDGNLDIYSMEPDGSGERRLTDDPAVDGGPSWSPDGTKIAFVRSTDDTPQPLAHIWLMDADGQNQVQLTAGETRDGSPSWSPDGARLVFTRGEPDGGDDLFVINADGSGVVPLTDLPESESSPTWSPDGSRIAFVHSRQPFFINSDGSGLTPLFINLTVWSIGWSPDGDHLVMAGTPSEIASNLVYTMNADGSELQRLTDPTGIHIALLSPQWSPDGSKIVYSTIRSADGDAEIVVMDADGTNDHRLTDNDIGDFTPSWQRLAPTPPTTPPPTTTTTPPAPPSVAPRFTG